MIVDEDQLQQRIPELVDTAVEAKVKTLEDRLTSLKWKISHLTEEQSNKNKLQGVEALENGQLPQEVKQKGLQREYGGVSQKRLCEMKGFDASNIAKIARNCGKTPQQYLMEKTVWVFRDKKYYPPAK